MFHLYERGRNPDLGCSTMRPHLPFARVVADFAPLRNLSWSRPHLQTFPYQPSAGSVTTPKLPLRLEAASRAALVHASASGKKKWCRWRREQLTFFDGLNWAGSETDSCLLRRCSAETCNSANSKACTKKLFGIGKRLTVRFESTISGAAFGAPERVVLAAVTIKF